MSPALNLRPMRHALLALASVILLPSCDAPNPTAPALEVPPSPLHLVVPGAMTATLIDRGNGLIYDADLDITYYDVSFGPVPWSAASSWANNLVVGGFNDWRLPRMKDNPANYAQSCLLKSYTDPAGPDRGYNKASSELGHLFYEELHGVALFAENPTCGPQNAPFGMTNGTGPFVSLQPARHYWTDQAFGSHHWVFVLGNGGQGTAVNFAAGYAIAVRDGDVSVAAATAVAALVPVPGRSMKHNRGRFTVEASCSDGSAPIATLNGVPVQNGMVVDLRVRNEKSDRSEKSARSKKSAKSKTSGRFDGTSFELLVECGGGATATAVPSFPDKSAKSDKSKGDRGRP